MMSEEKSRENRLRHMARPQGMSLQKSRLCTPNAFGYGGYMLVDTYHNAVVYGGHPWAFSAKLDEIEEFLSRSA
jgi:hypothetical protein